MKYIILCLLTLILTSCNVSGPNFPSDADETLDWGIRYARFGDEWWSVKNGEKWNKISPAISGRTMSIVVKKGKEVTLSDFGDFAPIVHYIGSIYGSDRDQWSVSFNTDDPQAYIEALRQAWSSKKYHEIWLRCHDGCYYSAD